MLVFFIVCSTFNKQQCLYKMYHQYYKIIIVTDKTIIEISFLLSSNAAECKLKWLKQ